MPSFVFKISLVNMVKTVAADAPKSRSSKTPAVLAKEQKDKEPKAPRETVDKGKASAFLTSVAYHINNEESKMKDKCKKALEAA